MSVTDTTSTAAAVDADWIPPGPGQWTLDRSHYPGGTTPISQWLIETGMQSGLGRVFAELGAPVQAISARFVNGFMYTRTVPLIGAGRSATRLPPGWVLRVVSRTHPTFRRRNRAAARMLADPPGPAVVKRWTEQLKPTIEAKNRSFAAVRESDLSDTDLAAHYQALIAHLFEMSDLHFWLHGYDLGPVARYVAFAKQHGLATSEAVEALGGASPSTTQPQAQLSAIKAAIGDARPTCLREAREQSSAAAVLIDSYLTERGSTLVTGYDLDALTLAELPETLFHAIMTATHADGSGPAPLPEVEAATRLRAQLPEALRGNFDLRLADARLVMDMRDDNGPIVMERPTGLLRTALLEIGSRLLSSGLADRREHALELDHHEVVELLLSRSGPSAGELSARASTRLADSRRLPPTRLGPVEPTPPADLLPNALAEFATSIQIALAELGMLGVDTSTDPLSGTGIGSAPYVGRARCAETPEEAVDAMKPGDVLVVRATSPAFNMVLTIAGAVVTADGGPLSHAAVLARELRIAAVVGAHGALDIPDGAMIEVDPVAGKVRILSVGP